MATLVDCSSKISELFYILKAELKALRGGDIAGIERFAAEKSSKLRQLSELMSALEAGAAVKTLQPQLDRLNALSLESGVVLKAVYNGIKSAQDRVRKITHQGAQVGAYGRMGQNLYFQEQSAGNVASY
ncbi:MAG: hypothetical protein COA43_11950 [Robiginitomaculum sp.]|nr:MAG: hypothetical protein COA43_11950 [Robiginitomaculum sp.]